MTQTAARPSGQRSAQFSNGSRGFLDTLMQIEPVEKRSPEDSSASGGAAAAGDGSEPNSAETEPDAESEEPDCMSDDEFEELFGASGRQHRHHRRWRRNQRPRACVPTTTTRRKRSAATAAASAMGEEISIMRQTITGDRGVGCRGRHTPPITSVADRGSCESVRQHRCRDSCESGTSGPESNKP